MDLGYVARHLEEDERHWWLVGRRVVLQSVLRATIPPGALSLVEIGCGGGSFLPIAAEFGRVVGIEASPEFLEVARRRGFTVLEGSLPDRIPLAAGSCDVALLFDVLEHIEDDREALRAVAGLLKPGGLVICTVPAYQWLWSSHDEVLGHRRRYTARGLRRLAGEAGLRPLRVTYFNALLALPIAGFRLLRRRRHARDHDLTRVPPFLNALLTRIFSSESGWLRRANFPFGVSVLMVARR